jgi:hypothetical protein
MGAWNSILNRDLNCEFYLDINILKPNYPITVLFRSLTPLKIVEDKWKFGFIQYI